jgi:outer membrane cobalamin receptor
MYKNIALKALFVFILSNLANLTIAQKATIFGIVTNEKDELLTGASVYWKDRKNGANTDIEGAFRLPARSKPDSLVVQYVGYNVVTIEVLPGEDSLWVVIQGITTLQGVDITEQVFGNSVSTLDPRNIESINGRELKKAPCCNLSESFETNGTVDLAFPNAITGVKEIQMLGLRGIYSQFLLENRPTLNGIATPFAFEMVPGSWLSGILLAKGASTVVNGFSGITGQINADLVKPLTDKPLFVNLFTSSEGRGEANIHLNKVKNDKTANGLLLHGSFVKNQWDRNNDNFYDMPNRHQLNALYRHQYQGDKVCYQFNVQALTDQRLSGQIKRIEGQSRFFDVNQRNERVEAWGKFGFEGLGGKPYQQLGNMASASWHRTDANYGPNIWKASQQSVYWQTLYQSIIGTTDHKYVIAPSIQYDDIKESVNESILDRKEFMPGVMGEYTFNRPNLKLGIPDLTVVAGARLDWNSRFQRWLFTPRASVKYNFTTETVARLSAGKGYRSPNLIAENVSLLASNKALEFAPNMGMESAWNYGVNLTHNFKLAGKKGSIAVDLYETDFQNQIVVDVDQSPLTISFYETKGNRSFSKVAMIMAQYNFFKGFEAKISAKYQDVRTTYSDGVLRWVPLTPRFRGLVTLDYTTPNKKWLMNVRTQLVGQQRLPDNSQVPHKFAHDFPTNSPVYSLWNTQVTYVFSSKMEIYIGGENLTNFQQHHAIMAYDRPESPYFNGAQLWAPMGGNIVYLGVRWNR